MKMFLALLLAGSLLVFGCLGGSGGPSASASPTAAASAAVSASSVATATPSASPVPSASAVSVLPSASPSPTASPSASPSSTVSAGGVKEISLQGTTNGGTSWQWLPGTITVKKGDHVKITIAVPAGDVRHGFALPAFGVDVKPLDPGTSTVVEFNADQAGAFDYFCDIPCGPGHREMRGKFVVTE